MVAASLATAIGMEPDIEVVGVVTDTLQAQRAADQEHIDVALVDYQLEAETGLELITHVHRTHPDIHMVMLTASESDRVLVAALEAGCAGFLTKGQSLPDVLAAVRAAAAGEAVIAPNMLTRLLPRLVQRSRQPEVELTDRESEILALMADGLGNQAIADKLYLSLHTVRNHVQSLLRKLDAHSKLEAVARAAKLGMLPALER